MNFSQANLPLGSLLSEHCGARQPLKQAFEIETPIEAVLELGQIPLGVFLEFEGVIGTGNRGLQVTQQRVNPTERRMLRRWPPRAQDQALMTSDDLAQPSKPAQTIGEGVDRRGQGALGP